MSEGMTQETFQLLDTIADSVNPCLGIAILVFAWLPAARGYGSPWSLLGWTIVGLAIVYGLQYLDNRAHLWPAVGLDYSTHTAVAVSLSTSLVVANWRWLFVLIPVLVFYAVLMMYLDYHSLTDILSTAVVVAPLTWAVHRLARRISLFGAAPPQKRIRT